MKNKIIFWVILFIGIAVRLYHVWSAPYAYVHRDNCTIWLMAKHILEGDIPLFFYGQYYLGPLEAMAIAFFFAIFGFKVYTFCLGTIFYSALFIISSYLLGKEIKDKTTGLFIMLFSALPSSYFFYESVSPLGYHIEILFLGNFILLLALKIPQVDSGAKKMFFYLLLGVCSGLGIWAHYIILYYLFPAFIYMAVNERWKYLITYSIPSALGFFIIALPFWIFTFKYNFITFGFSKFEMSALDISYLKELAGCVMYMFNLVFVPMQSGNLFKIIAWVLYIAAIVFFILVAILKKNFIMTKRSILIYFFLFMIFLYVYYKSTRNCGLGYNYILPVLTFVSVVFGYFCGHIYNKNKIMGLAVFSFVFCFNLADIGHYVLISQADSKTNKKIISKNIKYLEGNNFYRIVGCERDFKEAIFFSNERIIATGYTEYQYNKYADIVEMSDHVVFENSSDVLREVLNNICQSYEVKNRYFYNFKPHPYQTKIIRPIGWKAWANSNTHAARYAFDRDYSNFWISKEEGDNNINFTIDLGKRYKICKVSIHDPTGRYTPNFKIQSSINGTSWHDVISVNNIQPLFWSGPRPCWHLNDGRVEYFFQPVDARYIRFIKTDKAKGWWAIDEIYIYQYRGSEEFSRKDYVKDAYRIVRFLLKKGIDFIYADFWLSAKIKGITKNKIKALDAHNTFLPPRKYMGRRVRLDIKRAIVIKSGDDDEMEDILNELNLPFSKRRYKNFICYYFSDLTKGINPILPLEWIGTGVVKRSSAGCGRWFYKCAELMAGKRNQTKAVFYYKKAVKYLFGDINVYYAALNYYKQAGAKNEYQRLRKIIDNKFTPEFKYNVNFRNGIQFLGWSADGYNRFIGNRVFNIYYFWKVNKEFKDNIFVFVHFIKDGKIVFQNDHRLLAKYINPDIALQGGIWKGACRINIPSSVQPGEYTVKIGLWIQDKNNKRIGVKGSRSASAEIGKLNI